MQVQVRVIDQEFFHQLAAMGIEIVPHQIDAAVRVLGQQPVHEGGRLLRRGRRRRGGSPIPSRSSRVWVDTPTRPAR